MKKVLNTMNYFFAIALIFSFLIMVIAIVYTFIDLYDNYYFDISSKDYIDVFFNAFSWCKSIISNVFILVSVFYAFQTYKIHFENELFNNYISPKAKIINEKLNEIKEKNKKLHDFVARNGREIITMIIYNETNNSIGNKSRLEYYFNKYVKKEIKYFECSEHYRNNCKGNCSTCENKDKVVHYHINSFEHFKLIAFELFCISFEYSDFDTDIKNIYEINCSK